MGTRTGVSGPAGRTPVQCECCWLQPQGLWEKKKNTSSALPQQRAAPACLKLQSPPRRCFPHLRFPAACTGSSSLVPGQRLGAHRGAAPPKNPTLPEAPRSLPAPGFAPRMRVLCVPSILQHPLDGMQPLQQESFPVPEVQRAPGMAGSPGFAGLRQSP